MSLPIENCDYFVYLAELPPKIYAMLISNGDGTFSMYLDPRRDFEHWVDDYEHELWHLIRDDLFNDDPIWVIEAA